MSESVFCLVALLLLSIAFAVLTILAHRTHPQAKKTFTVGLAVTTAIAGLLWWSTSPSFATLSITGQAISVTLFIVLSLGYSQCVLQSRSALRWAGAFAAVILLIVSLTIDIITGARTRDVAISIGIILLGTNFLGHLIRARINQMLLRVPSGAKENAKIAATLSLIKTSAGIVGTDALDTLTTDIVVAPKRIATVVYDILSALHVSRATAETIDIEAKASAKMHDLIYVARIACAIKNLTQETFRISVNETDIAFSIQNTLSTQTIEALSRTLYGLAVDAVEVSDEQINARFRKR